MRSSVVLVAALAACGRPDVLVICHNANCVEPQDPDNDDSIASLAKSLALVDDDGVPVIDGLEMDLLLHDGRCLFAHDGGHAKRSIDIVDAAAIVGEHIRNGALRADQFIVQFDLKTTPAVAQSVDCAIAAFAVLRDAAIARGIALDMRFGSYAPAMLREAHARDSGAQLILGLGVPQPLLDDNHPFSELGTLDVDIVEVHPGWITDAALRAVRSMDVEIGAWFLDMTRETLDGIRRVRPAFVVTGQARSLRSWLDYE